MTNFYVLVTANMDYGIMAWNNHKCDLINNEVFSTVRITFKNFKVIEICTYAKDRRYAFCPSLIINWLWDLKEGEPL